MVLTCWWVILVCESNAMIVLKTAMPLPPTHKSDEFLELANLQPLGELICTPVRKHVIVVEAGHDLVLLGLRTSPSVMGVMEIFPVVMRKRRPIILVAQVGLNSRGCDQNASLRT